MPLRTKTLRNEKKMTCMGATRHETATKGSLTDLHSHHWTRSHLGLPQALNRSTCYLDPPNLPHHHHHHHHHDPSLEAKHIRWTPHPVIANMRDDRDCIRVLLYPYYTTITRWGVHLLNTKDSAQHPKWGPRSLLWPAPAAKPQTLNPT